MPHRILCPLALVLVAAAGCAKAPLHAEVPALPLATEAAAAAAPKPLVQNHFRGDRLGQLSEDALRKILAAPVAIEDGARVGVVPVADAYQPEAALPLVGLPKTLVQRLDETGVFDMVTEVATDWPASSGLPGLRELAARYRAEYLLLYRYRFEERTTTNAWAFAYVTVLGALVVPSQTLEATGVLEATLFDVRSGTLLFTIQERVRGSADETIWSNERKQRELRETLMDDTADRLAKRVARESQLLAKHDVAAKERVASPVRSPLAPQPLPVGAAAARVANP